MDSSAGRDPIGVIGVGWVGLVTAVCFAETGFEVFAVDVNEEKIEALRGGEATMHEPGLQEMLARNLERIHFTTEMDEALAGARLLFCCVDTPPTYSGDADLSRVQAVVERLPEDDQHALVMKSTVPAGTGQSIRRDRPGLAYVSCPEFLKEGSALDDFMHPDRVVIGSDPGAEWAADAVARLYEPLGGEIVHTDVASAEMIKLASNAFLATKISFINEIANVCEEVGADVTEVARGMGLDERIGPSFLRAGVGYGGSCFVGEETLLVKLHGSPRLVSFEALWETCAGDAAPSLEAIEPEGLYAWSWVPGEAEPEWMPVSVLTRRSYEGEVIAVRTETGHRVKVTADHPFVVGDGRDDEVLTRVLAEDLAHTDWLPVASRFPHLDSEPALAPVGAGFERSVSSRTKRIVPSGSRAFTDSMVWARVTDTDRSHFRGPVYSLKVPGSQTVVTSGGLIVSQCFPKDVSALKQLAGNTGYHFQLLTAVIEVNELQKRRVVAKLEKHLGSLVGKRVALLGLAFKANTDDMREATSLVLSARLIGEGASVSAYDPVAQDAARSLIPRIEFADSAEGALDGADAAILVTEWPEFAELDWAALGARMKQQLIIDGRNFLDPDTLHEAGFIYEGIGRGRGARRR